MTRTKLIILTSLYFSLIGFTFYIVQVNQRRPEIGAGIVQRDLDQNKLNDFKKNIDHNPIEKK